MPANKPGKSNLPDAHAGQVISGRAEYVERVLAMIGGARRDCALLSFNLDPRLYNRDDIAEAIKQFVLISQHSRLRVLLNDAAPAARGHRIVDLGRTLSSFIEFRVLGEHQRSVKSECLISDEQQVLERRNPDNLESRYYPSNPPLARAKRRQFDEWWDAAEPASALRSLHFG